VEENNKKLFITKNKEYFYQTVNERTLKYPFNTTLFTHPINKINNEMGMK